MINTLYPQFRHWSTKGSVYIISDPHFLDEDMNWRWDLIKDYPCELTDTLNSKYIAERMADYLVWKINKKVHKPDTLVILGDVGDTKYVKQLKAGYKVLVTGNHDEGTENYLKRNFCGYPYCKDLDCESCKHYKAQLFDEVYSGPLWIAEKILLSHEPIPIAPNIVYNIHGHLHDEDAVVEEGFGLNCAAEKIGFTPVSLKSIIDKGVLKKVDGIHRVTIDRATESGIKKKS